MIIKGCRFLIGCVCAGVLCAGVTQPVHAAGEAERDLQLAEVSLTQGLWPVAEEALTRALADAPQTVDGDRIRRRSLTLLAELYRQTGRPGDAVKQGQKLAASLKALPPAAREPAMIDNALRLAEDYVALQTPDAARDLLNDLLAGRLGSLKAVPKLSATLRLAIVEEATRHDEAAHPLWEQVLRQSRELLARHRSTLQDADQVECLRAMISAHEGLQQSASADKARDELLQFVRSHRQLSERDMWVDLATQRALRKDVRGAADEYQKAIDLTPARDPQTRGRLHLRIAQFWRDNGNTRKAITEYQLAMVDFQALIKHLDQTPEGKRSVPAVQKQLQTIGRVIEDLLKLQKKTESTA